MQGRPKVFTRQEANQLLPELNGLLEELEEKQRGFERRHDELLFEEILENSAPPETRLQELETLLTSLGDSLKKIRERGCLLRHLRQGNVDFLGREGGEWVFYCWRRGEPDVRFYHTLQGGFFERRELPCAGASRS